MSPTNPEPAQIMTIIAKQEEAGIGGESQEVVVEVIIASIPACNRLDKHRAVYYWK